MNQGTDSLIKQLLLQEIPLGVSDHKKVPGGGCPRRDMGNGERGTKTG